MSPSKAGGQTPKHEAHAEIDQLQTAADWVICADAEWRVWVWSP